MNAVRWFAGVVLFGLSTSQVHAQYGQSANPEHTFSQGQNAPAPRAADWAETQQNSQNEEAAYKAMTAAAEAQEAMYKAQLAGLKLKYGGGLTGSEFEGSVTIDTTKQAGMPEAILLVNRSVADVAIDINRRISRDIGGLPCETILVLTKESSLSQDAAILFDLHADQVRSALHAAKTQFNSASRRDPGDGTEREKEPSGSNRSAILTAGSVIEGLSKLGSYFQTDYTFGPVDMQHFDATSIAYALAGLIAKPQPENVCQSREVLIPERRFVSSLEAVSEELKNLNAMYIQVLGQKAASQARVDTLTKGEKGLAASRYTNAIAAADQAIQLYTSFITMITKAPEAKSESFLTQVLRQKQTRQDIEVKKPHILMVNGQAAGQYYTRKSLWTFFGGPQLYTAGAVTASYMLMDHSGKLLTSGTAASHGGYRSVRQVQRLVDGDRGKDK